MSNYQDEDTRWHDRTRGSNNGWTYSAYSKYLAPDTLDTTKLLECYRGCLRSREPLKVDRSPNQLTPPVSKDEIIGLVSLGLLSRDTLKDSHWNFCNLEYTPKKLTLLTILKAAKVFYEAKKEAKEYLELYKKTDEKRYLDLYKYVTHRNYFWQNKLTDTYALAFYLAPWDQYYVNKYLGFRPTLIQTIFFYLNAYSTLTKGNKSVKMLLWLQLTDMKHWLLRFTKKKGYVENYFEEEHPFRKGL